MNMRRRTKQLRKFLLKHGEITSELALSPNKFFRPYQKGCHYAAYSSDKLNLSCCVGGINKIKVYKEIAKIVRKELTT